MALSDSRILSEPCQVLFAGWESTTTRLQQAGWQLSAEQDFNRMSIRLALKFEPARLFMVAECQDWDYMRYARSPYRDGHPPTFQIRHAASDMHIQLMESSFDFRPFDAKPQFTSAERKSIKDFGIFAPCLARTEEIIVEPQTVAALLDEIRKLQAPELAEIRKRNADRDRRNSTEPMAQQRFHAQIVSLAA